MSPDEMRSLVSQAMLAPSVHNVQPARWRMEADSLVLFEDVRCRLPVGDPRGNDAGISLGAAVEGLRLAGARISGRQIEVAMQPLPPSTASLAPVARCRLGPSSVAPDPLADFVEARRSWRAAFAPATSEDRDAALKLSDDQSAVIADERRLKQVAQWFDAASYGFMRDPDFRRELVSWMRLSSRHPRWRYDGLNADAMAMTRWEAAGVGAILGPLFRPLDRLGIAAALLAEGKKVASAAAVVIFHRPRRETPFESGRHFYRLWLRLEAAGFGATVLAALADDANAAQRVRESIAVPADHRIVSAFRIGRRPLGRVPPRARRPVDEILL